GQGTGHVPERHRRLVDRWLRVLEEHGLVATAANGTHRSLEPHPAKARALAWDEIDAGACGQLDDPLLMDYFRTSGEQLAELLMGRQDPVQLLFPQGRFEVADALYRDALFNRWANEAVADMAVRVAQETGSAPVRVLEVGAGTGATTAAVLRRLAQAGIEVDYLYSDVSGFFLNEARLRFQDWPGMRYATVDLDADLRGQGVAPHSADLVIAGDVLHATGDPFSAARSLNEVLVPGGWLLVQEMTREHHQILSSLELMEPHGQGRDRVFLDRDSWLTVLGEARLSTEAVVPDAGDPMAELGMHIFAARAKPDRMPLNRAGVIKHLTQRLPEYMIPTQVQVLDALPVTGNGKVNRQALLSWLPGPRADHPGRTGDDAAKPVTAGSASGTADDLTRRVGALWCEVLQLPRVDPEQNFFDLGGDSLLAAQLAGRLLGEIPEAAAQVFDQLLRLVLEAPSLAVFADRLTWGSGPDPVTVLHPDGSSLIGLGGPPEGPMVVVVHDGTTGIAGYATFVASLMPRARLFGLVVVNIEEYLNHDPALLVERVAGMHVTALAELDRPVHLVGARFGGLVACEVARQLLETGNAVAGLTVIGCPGPLVQVDEPLLVEYLFARELGVHLEHAGLPDPAALGALVALRTAASDRLSLPDPATLPDALATLVGRLAATAPADRLAAIAQAVPPGVRAALEGDNASQWLSALSRALQAYRHSLVAASTAELPLYAGDLTVVTPRDAAPWNRPPEQTQQWWSELCLGELRVLEVPGDDVSCLDGSAAALVAQAVHPG
ncbi:MAG: methyltransferase, partial [Actinobacteria bacterium]|nr:methyltransferase [Actinomycetota bacterium]